MYKLTFLVIFLLGAFAPQLGQCQNGIDSRLEEYFEATKSEDWEKVADLLYPKLFELVKKEDMIQMFRDMEGNGMKFSMSDFEARKISEPFTHEDEQFALVDYSAKMSIQFTSQAYKEPEMVQSLQSSFHNIYGEENVSFNPEENSFDILAEKAMFAIAPRGSKEWSFIENTPEMEATLGNIVPKEVRQHFNGSK